VRGEDYSCMAMGLMLIGLGAFAALLFILG